MRYKYTSGTTEVTLPDGAVEDEINRLSETHPQAAGVLRQNFELFDIAPEIACTRQDLETSLNCFNEYLDGTLDAQGLHDAIESNVTVA